MARRSSSSTRRAALALGVTLGLISACADERPPLPELEVVAHPELGAYEDITRRQLSGARDRLEKQLDEGQPRDIADAFGGLGELYHAYDLLEPAAACYRNARRLDAESFLWPYYLGVLHHARDELDAAATALEAALDLRPDDTAALMRLAEVRLAAGEPAPAAELFRQALGDKPFAAAAHFGLGRALAAAGDADEATSHFEQALGLAPADDEARAALAAAVERLDGDEPETATVAPPPTAVAFPDRRVERLETLARSSDAHLRRGLRELQAGDAAAALPHLRRAVDADPDNLTARRRLADALIASDDLDGALRELRDAADAAPRDAAVRYHLGTTYLAGDLPDAAAEVLRQALALDPSFHRARVELGAALVELERWDDARGTLGEALATDGNDRRARWLAARADLGRGDTPGGIDQLDALLASDAGDIEVREALATAIADSGDLHRAANVYRAGLALAPTPQAKASLLGQLAELTWRQRQVPQAIGYWRQAVELTPGSSQAHTDLANGLQLSGQRAEALEHFASAVELDPANLVARRSQASLLILTGAHREARQRLDEGLARAPNDPTLEHTLARLLATSHDAEVRDGRQALTLAQRAYSREASLEHAETLAMALAELGNFEAAIQTQRQLAAQASVGGDQRILRRLVSNLRLYESRRPVRVRGGEPG